MLDQKTLERPTRLPPARETRPQNRGVAELTNDLLHLSELQLDLLQVDIKDFLKRSTIPIALLAVAAILLLGCVPAVILSIVWAVTDGGTTNFLSALLIVLGVGGVLIVALGAGGYLLIRKSLAIPKRSFYEFKRNISWARESLKSHVNNDF